MRNIAFAISFFTCRIVLYIRLYHDETYIRDNKDQIDCGKLCCLLLIKASEYNIFKVI
jgi:hypothetical protein